MKRLARSFRQAIVIVFVKVLRGFSCCVCVGTLLVRVRVRVTQLYPPARAVEL
jgi:hypothetical protein